MDQFMKKVPVGGVEKQLAAFRNSEAPSSFAPAFSLGGKAKNSKGGTKRNRSEPDSKCIISSNSPSFTSTLNYKLYSF